MSVQVLDLVIGERAGAAAAIGVATASAMGFATSNALQHRVAGRVPGSVSGAFEVLGHLVTQRLWLVATTVSCVALLLHATALRLGSLALVQPMMLAGVVLAVPLRAAVEHKVPSAPELRAVVVTVVGLAAFVVCVNPRPSEAPAHLGAGAAFVAAGFACGVWALRRAANSGANARRRAGLLGAGAGVMFGLTAGLLKVVTNAVASGQVATFGFLISFGCLVGAGLLGTAMNQRAYQIAPLSFSMPVVNVVDIVVAILFGVLVFGEAPAHSPGRLLLQAGGLALAVLGLRMIASLKEHGAASACQLFEARR